MRISDKMSGSGAPPSPHKKLTNIPNSPTQIQNKCPYKKEEKSKTKEEVNIEDSFKKLSIGADCQTVINVQDVLEDEAKLSLSDSESDRDSKTSNSNFSDSDDERTAKGPESSSKQSKTQRGQHLPYPDFNWCRKHHSGGYLILDRNVNNLNYFQPQQQNTYEASSQPPDDDDINLNIFDESLTSDQRKQLDEILKYLSNESTEIEDVSETTFRLPAVVDIPKDDGYETSSPNSFGYETSSPNSFVSDLENSPSHESQSYNSFGGEVEPITPSCLNVLPEYDRSRLLNIPLAGQSITLTALPNPPSVLPKALLTAPTQRPNIAPESVIVQEAEMKKTAQERIKTKLDRTILEIEWIKVLNDKEFLQVNRDKDETKMMTHLKTKMSKHFYEILHCQLERIKYEKEKEKCLKLLKYTNRRGASALSIALSEYRDTPVVARYIVEVLSFLGDDVNQVDRNDNTLIHRLVENGDGCVHVMAELLNTRTASGQLCFDVNKKNHLLETPLHIATKLHLHQSISNASTFAISKLLINHNANVLMENSDGMTPIHLVVRHSCSPQLLRALLSSNHFLDSKCVDLKDHFGNTALHLAAMRNDLPVHIQSEIIRQLFASKWSHRIENHDGKTPASFLTTNRKVLLQQLKTKSSK